MPSGAWFQSLTVGDWVSVRAHRNRFVQSITLKDGTTAGTSTIEGEWFSDVSPPIGFTLDSVVDFTVQVTPPLTVALSYVGGDGDCYGWDLLSSDELWQLASQPRPMGYTTVHAEGRFEGGILLANEVWLCR